MKRTAIAVLLALTALTGVAARVAWADSSDSNIGTTEAPDSSDSSISTTEAP